MFRTLFKSVLSPPVNIWLGSDTAGAAVPEAASMTVATVTV